MTLKVRVIESSRDGFVMKYRDAAGFDRQRRCFGKTQRARETERKQLEQQLNDRASELSWSEFWSRMDEIHFADYSAKYRSKCFTMHGRVADSAKRRGIRDLKCSDISPTLLLDVEAAMKSADMEPATVRGNMAALWAMIAWGQDSQLIPDFRKPRRRRGKKDKQTRKSKGRSLTVEEIERMQMCIPKCVKRKEQPEGFIAAMEAMRLIGMRLSECWLFSWDPVDGTHHPVRLDTSNAAVSFADVQKNGEACEVPLTDEAIAWLRKLRDARLPDASPWVCRTVGARGEHATPNRLGRIVADSGRMARVVVKRFDKADGEKIKYASAHDLRRTFATNLQRDLTISEQQRLTRHSDAKTLLDHYADAPTPSLVAKLRGGG